MTPTGQILLAVLGILATTCIAMLGYMFKRLSQHDSALAVLIDQVNPPGRPSLREILSEIEIQVAVGNAQTINSTQNQNATQTTTPNRPSLIRPQPRRQT